MRNLIIGDTHGSYERLMEVLSKASFDPESDNLYSTGDLADRGEGCVDVIRYLFSLPNFFPVMGNHDLWLLDYLVYGDIEDIWYDYNGGHVTVRDFDMKNVSKSEREKIAERISSTPLLRFSSKWIIAHAGIPFSESMDFLEDFSNKTPEKQRDSFHRDYFVWDREYVDQASEYERAKEEGLDDDYFALPPDTEGRILFVGHTPFIKLFSSEAYHVIDLDTGGFHPTGCMTVMDMDTLEYWQSGKDGKMTLSFER